MDALVCVLLCYTLLFSPLTSRQLAAGISDELTTTTGGERGWCEQPETHHNFAGAWSQCSQLFLGKWLPASQNQTV